MPTLKIKDADGNDIYVNMASGAGTSGDPFIPSQEVTFPSAQDVAIPGGVNVGNFPATQPVSGTVSVGNFPAQFHDWHQALAEGEIAGHSLVNKFGYNGAVTSTLQPVATAATYQTPTTAQSLEIVSSDANDTAAGSGAQKVIVEGLDASWNVQTQEVTLNGTTAVAITGTWLRVYRAYVSESGTYATEAAGSHAGTLTIRLTGAGATWAQIALGVGGFPLGQTDIGAYTIPAGYTGYMLAKTMNVESDKSPNVVWFRRENADDVTAPYPAMRLFERHAGVVGQASIRMPSPHVTLPEKTDIGVLAHVATGTAAISVEFQILLVANP